MAELHITTTPPLRADVSITFGDGVGFGVLQTMFEHLAGYTVAIDGKDYVFMHCEQHSDDWVFVVREYPPPPSGQRAGTVHRIKLGDLTTFHIF